MMFRTDSVSKVDIVEEATSERKMMLKRAQLVTVRMI